MGGGNESRDGRHLLRFSLVYISCSCFKVFNITILSNEYLEIEKKSHYKQNNEKFPHCYANQGVYLLFHISLSLFHPKSEYKFGKCITYNFLVKKVS